VTEWQSAEDRNSREKINRARQAAEQLFKPTSPAADAALAGTAAEAPQPPRQPRIFAAPPRVPVTAAADGEAAPRMTRRRAASPRRAATVPPSQIGRVRALATYGMTCAQVAELYGVTADEIERIVAGPAHTGRSR
jgi:hypothetical protein